MIPMGGLQAEPMGERNQSNVCSWLLIKGACPCQPHSTRGADDRDTCERVSEQIDD
jgi:hypothetical protein